MSLKPSTISPEQETKIHQGFNELRTLISLMVAASTGRDEFDTEGFALMMEDKFAELYDVYHEAVGDKPRYQRFSSK